MVFDNEIQLKSNNHHLHVLLNQIKNIFEENLIIYNETINQNSREEAVSLGEGGGETKSIPAGKYGMSLFIKYFGVPELRECSIGLLLILVQWCLWNKFLYYKKGFVLKSSKFDSMLQQYQRDPDFYLSKNQANQPNQVKLKNLK